MVSSSDSPLGSCSPSRRRDCGMSTRRSLVDWAPSFSSMAARSSGEWTRYGNLVVRGLCHLLVRILVEQVGRWITCHLELEDPAFTERVGVDQLWLRGELLVDLADPPGDRRVEVARRLDRLDDAEGLADVELAADLGELEEHHVAELRLGEVGDANRRVLAVDSDPLVRLGV